MMQLCLSQVCSLNSLFEQDIVDYAAGKCEAIEVWFTKLENYLKSHSLDDVKRLMAEHHMALPVASYQGGLFTIQGEARSAAWDLFRSRLAVCHDLGIGTLVVAADLGPPLRQETIDQLAATLLEIATLAGQHEIKIALEFQARSAFVNNLQTAAAVVTDTGSPHLGICLDLFHYYVGPSKPQDLPYLTRKNLFHVQLSDIADIPREFATDSDRILPGEGDIDLTVFTRFLEEMGYCGPISIELLNPQIWQVPPRQFGEIAMTSLRKAVGQADR